MIARMSFVFSVIAAMGALLWASAATSQTIERPLFAPGEIIVKFNEEVASAARQSIVRSNGLRVLRELRGIGALYSALPPGIDPLAAKARLESLPQVLYAEPNYYRYLDAVPNDARFDELWGLDNNGQTGGTPDADIDAPEAWDIATGSRNVIVAVIDSGTDIDHPDLAANIYVNPGEIPGNGIDDDGNGFVDDVSGWDFRDNDNDPRDTSDVCAGHGTHTAGTVGAVGNNGVGVSGVAQNVSILPIRALGRIRVLFLVFCGASDADLIDAIDYAAMMGARISSNSWGGDGFSTAVRNAIARSRHLFVAAAGNDGRNTDNNPHYPSGYDLDNIVAVAATDDNDVRAGFSNFGVSSVDLAAPGVDILSTLPGNSYGYADGTSMATPHVAGAAAVLASANPGLTVAELKDRLLRGVDGLGLQVLTGGRLNLNNTLLIPDSPLVVTMTPLGPTTVFRGATISFQVSVENTSPLPQSVSASIRAWTPTGGEPFIFPPLNITVPGNDTVQTTVSESIPLFAPVGDYVLIGRLAGSPEQFEEAQLVYTVN